MHTATCADDDCWSSLSSDVSQLTDGSYRLIMAFDMTLIECTYANNIPNNKYDQLSLQSVKHKMLGDYQ